MGQELLQESEKKEKVFSKDDFEQALSGYISAIYADYGDSSSDCADYHGLKKKKAEIIKIFQEVSGVSEYSLWMKYRVLKVIAFRSGLTSDRRLGSYLVSLGNELDEMLNY